MTRFQITRICLDVLRKLGQPKTLPMVHFQSVERHLKRNERDAFYDAYNSMINYGTKMSRRFEAAIMAGTILSCRKLSTEEFSTFLSCKLGQEPKNPDAYGGGDWKIGRQTWRILDTYGDEDQEKGEDLIYTLCAVSGVQVVVAEFYWCFHKGRVRVRNEARGRLGKPMVFVSKRAFYYDPVNAIVSLRHMGDKRIKVHVE